MEYGVKSGDGFNVLTGAIRIEKMKVLQMKDSRSQTLLELSRTSLT